MIDDKYMDKSLIERPSILSICLFLKLVRTNALEISANKLNKMKKKTTI